MVGKVRPSSSAMMVMHHSSIIGISRYQIRCRSDAVFYAWASCNCATWRLPLTLARYFTEKIETVVAREQTRCLGESTNVLRLSIQ